MQAPLPGPPTEHTPAHYGFDVPVLLRRWVAGPRADDAVRVAGELVAEGRRVAFGPSPGRSGDAAAEFTALAVRVQTAGFAASCELTVPVDLLGRTAALDVARAGLPVVLSGTPSAIDALTAEVPAAGVAVPAGEAGAEARCRHLAGRRVRLVAGRGAHADLAFVRCLNVLMAGEGRPGVATADLRLIAIAGERAAWNGRSPDSWEHVMPYGVRTAEQRRLAAAGLIVRVTVPSGPGAVPAAVRALVGRA